MGKTTKIEGKERQKIVDLLQEHGGNQNRVAKICGRSQTAVGKIAKEEGISSVKKTPKKAIAAHIMFSQQDRMLLISRALNRGGRFLEEHLTPQQFKDVMTAIAIGIDKHRLETGEVTSRSESHSHSTSSEDLDDFFRDLDAARKEGGEGGTLQSLDTDEADGETT